MFASAAFNQTGREYLLSANDNVMICVQIESRKAVENVEEIAAVEGIGRLPRVRGLSGFFLCCANNCIAIRYVVHWTERPGLFNGLRRL